MVLPDTELLRGVWLLFAAMCETVFTSEFVVLLISLCVNLGAWVMFV